MEYDEENMICKLCLRSCECAFVFIEAATIEMMGFIGIELDINTSEKLVICDTCSENLQKCFDFKTVCLYTEDCINSFKNDTNRVPLDLREIYLRKNENENSIVSKCDSICRLCMEIADPGYYTTLNDETKDTSVKAILERFFSELNLGIFKNPVVCMSCNASLHSYFSFLGNCLHREDKIKTYCKIEENNEPQEEPNNVLQFVTENINYKNGYIDAVVHENYSGTELYNGIKLETENLMEKESQDLHIKQEVNENGEFVDIEVEKVSIPQFAQRDTLCCNNDCTDMDIVKMCHKDEQNCDIGLKRENDVEMESLGYDIKIEDIGIKTEEGEAVRYQNNVANAKDTSEVAVYQCKIDTFETNKSGLNKYFVLHNNVSQDVVHQCEECDFKTRNKSNFSKHVQRHKNAFEVKMHSCELCTYKAKRKACLNRHMLLIHKDASEVPVYQCQVCMYTSKLRAKLERHMLIHNNDSEVATYQCELCIYKSDNRSKLKRHMLVHKSTSEVTMYACEICTYKAKLKDTLKQHMLTHKDTSEITMYSCEICTYKAKHKGNLNQHMLTHKSASEKMIYQCDLCTYKSRTRSRFKRHMFIHESPSEIFMYQCELCTYKSEVKSRLERHVLSHKDTAEVMMYKCELCSYMSKERGKVTRHMIIHKSASEVTTYPCGICTYKAKLKDHLKRHMSIHKTPSEVAWNQCDRCEFKTRYKKVLRKHELLHKSSCEVKTQS